MNSYFYLYKPTNKMKNCSYLLVIIAAIISFTRCNTSKKASTVQAPAKITYEADMVAVIQQHCSPCHIPSNGGRKKAFDNFTNLKNDIDEIIKRIELNPTDKGFMPFKKTAKMSDSTIAVFKQWKAGGMMEK
jgi:uncharacterized membrane protein